MTVVVWRGRHPIELSADGAGAYWQELMRVRRAIDAVMAPIKLIYAILGNFVPQLHTHVIRGCADDPRPESPFPFPESG